MSEFDVEASVLAISSWPQERVRHAYRLAVSQVHAALRQAASPEQLRPHEEEAALFGAELLRRKAF